MRLGAYLGVSGFLISFKQDILNYVPVKYTIISGYLVLGVSLMFAVAGLMDVILKPVIRISAKKIWRIVKGDWLFSTEKVSIDSVLDFFYDVKNVFGEDVAPVHSFLGWLKKNSKIAWRVTRSSISTGAVEGVGFFEIIPINKTAVKKIKSGSMDGRTLDISDIATSRNVAAYYIGSVASTNSNPVFKATTLLAFIHKLEEMAEENDITLFTRPVSHDGLRLVREFGFEKILSDRQDSASSWKLELTKDRKLIDFRGGRMLNRINRICAQE